MERFETHGWPVQSRRLIGGGGLKPGELGLAVSPSGPAFVIRLAIDAMADNPSPDVLHFLLKHDEYSRHPARILSGAGPSAWRYMSLGNPEWRVHGPAQRNKDLHTPRLIICEDGTSLDVSLQMGMGSITDGHRLNLQDHTLRPVTLKGTDMLFEEWSLWVRPRVGSEPVKVVHCTPSGFQIPLLMEETS